jgi:hypothetical protein
MHEQHRVPVGEHAEQGVAAQPRDPHGVPQRGQHHTPLHARGHCCGQGLIDMVDMFYLFRFDIDWCHHIGVRAVLLHFLVEFFRGTGSIGLTFAARAAWSAQSIFVNVRLFGAHGWWHYSSFAPCLAAIPAGG